MEQNNQNIEQQSTIERVKHSSLRMRAFYSLRRILVGFILISFVNGIFSYLFYTPKVHSINKRNSALTTKYNLLSNRIMAAESRLEEIAHRDNFVYRSLFGVDSLPMSLSDVTYPESKYAALQGDYYSPAMTSSWKKMDRLARNLYSNSLSFDQLQVLAQNKEDMSAALPAIWPIDRTELNSISHFGMRNHPIYNKRIMHKGIDLGSKLGTPVFATGDGVVEKSSTGLRYSGYGQEVLINHEYSYKTRYAHLSKRYVQRGDSVKRGQIIGEVGSTGGSTGAHLHYEVIYKGTAVNPINYFDRNMSNEEYMRLMEDMKLVEYEIIDSLEHE